MKINGIVGPNKTDADNNKIDSAIKESNAMEKLLAAIKEMELCVNCLAVEVPGVVYDDVKKKWIALKDEILNTSISSNQPKPEGRDQRIATTKKAENVTSS